MLKFGQMLQMKHLSTALNSYREQINSQLRRIQFPEKWKGTIFEKWKDYWQNLFFDYRDVAKDTIKTAKSEPKKSAAILSLFAFSTYCFKTNPDENNYRDTVISYSTQLIMIGPAIRNPGAKKYLEEIETYYNQEILKRVSLGLFSLILKENYNDYIGIYKAHCPYLEVPFYKFYEKIVDIGFMNRWHILEKEMIDCDVNPQEWSD